jgi:hypothetical protein
VGDCIEGCFFFVMCLEGKEFWVLANFGYFTSEHGILIFFYWYCL